MDAGHLLVADLDGTLLGDDAALARLVAWLGARRDRYRIVYASGRHLASVRDAIARTDLLEPDAVISAVGTEIHDPAGRPWTGWLERFDGWTGDGVRRVLAGVPWLAPQPDSAQTDLKASYDVPGLGPADLASLERILAAAGLRSMLVYSGNLFLDVLPAAAGKGHAARFLADAWGLAPRNVLVFGDSGNDLQMFEQGFRGTVVANALPELGQAVGPDVYHSPLAYADGVLDGLLHWSQA